MTEDSKTAAALAKDVSAGALDDETKAGAIAKEPIEADASPAKAEAAAEAAPTLREIFSIPEKPTDQTDDSWKAFQETLSKEAKGIKWTAALPDLASKICELLDVKVHDVLLAAWKKVEALKQALEESRKTPEKVVYLDLAEHSIDYETKPFIDVKIKSASVRKLTLTVMLNLKLKGFVLKVQNGAIREIQTGNCEAKGSVKYGTLSIAEKKLEPIKFPVSIQVPALTATGEHAMEAPENKVDEAEEPPKPTPKAEPSLERIEL
jgi:hypothetical protein